MRTIKLTPIIVAGFGWSGSSAIIDFLFDLGSFEGFGREYPGETKILNKVIVDDLESFFEKKLINKIKINDFLALMSGGHFGLEDNINEKILLTKIDLYEKNKIIFEADLSFWIYISLKFKDLVITKIEDIKIEYIRIIKIVFDYLSHKEKICIFNNDVHIHNNDSHLDLRFFNKILVFRNPLDQYSEKKEKSMRFKSNRFKLIIHVLHYNKSLVNSLMKKKKDNNLKIVNFENFILKKKYREDLLKTIDYIKYNHQERNNYFNPSKSINNIRIPREELNLFEKLIISISCYPIYYVTRFLN